MNVAEDVGNTGAIETDITGRAGLVQTEIKSLAFEQRKDVVKERIAIGKLNHCSDGNNQQVRFKALVMLSEPQPPWRKRRDRRMRIHRAEPDHDILHS